MTKSKKTTKTRKKIWLQNGTKSNNNSSRSLLCIQFVTVAFWSEEEVLWRRSPSLTYSCPVLDPPEVDLAAKPKHMCKAMSTSFLQRFVVKSDYVFLYIYMHQCIPLPLLYLNKYITRHVFVKHECPRRQESQSMARISKSYILTSPQPQGHVMSVKCEELTVQFWLVYDHQNFKYCTLFISGTELRTDKQTDRQMDDPNTSQMPPRTFQAGGIKTSLKFFNHLFLLY